ncbi:glycosyltransferase [candidate division KSB3 bacterium]|uniref:Glycosyltransferase n=1 Tax=candidate division KSB3 bacterium TaxID=2044937 RepID=A0A9D5JUW2_9BACT|nr:glycosyltransferase [candidate division KSB3 bacterium]MBD3324713.1 glycosyltransferase [candidate division KSB3 bacterium]
MAKTRVLEFSTSAKIGGTQHMLLEFLRHASRERYDLYLCVLLAHDVLNDEAGKLGIPQTSLQMRGYWDLRAWWRFYHFARGKEFDLMRTYGLKADIIGRIVGKLLGIPVHITSVRSTDPWRRWYHVLLDVLTAGLTDLYLSNSEAGRLAVHQREKIPLSKIAVIPNGVDLVKFAPRPSENASLQKTALGIPPNAPVIGSVANLCPMKGHTTIVDALPLIQDEFPEVRCLFVGMDFLQGAIQRYVRERQLEEAVMFTGFRTDIPRILSLFDVFLLPSLWEGLPNAMLEAMAMKLPVVASAVGDIPNVIEHQRTGFLIPPQNPHALAETVLGVLRHPEAASKIGHAGHDLIRRQFSLESVVTQTERLYDQLIERKGKQP